MKGERMRGSSKPFRLLLPVLLLLATTSTHLHAGAPGAVAIQFPNIVQPTCAGGSFDTPAFSITRRLGLSVGFGSGSLIFGALCSGATPPATCAIPPLPDTVCAPAGNGTCVGELQLAPCQLGTPIA